MPQRGGNCDACAPGKQYLLLPHSAVRPTCASAIVNLQASWGAALGTSCGVARAFYESIGFIEGYDSELTPLRAFVQINGRAVVRGLLAQQIHAP